MRLGGATGAPPASRSGHHDRSQPAPPPPMLRNGGSGAGRSLRSFQFDARPLGQCQPLRPWRSGQPPRRPRRRAQRARPPQPPPPPVLRNGGWRGLRLTIRNSTSTPLARPRTRPHQFERPRRSQRARPPSTPACHAGCFRSFHIERPTASRPRTPAAKPTPAEPRTPPDRFVRARLRCSSRASLPLTPQAGTPTATIGMRPATSLRTKTKLVNTTPSGCRASWVLLRVQRCPRPYRPENALSIKKCERAFSGR